MSDFCQECGEYGASNFDDENYPGALCDECREIWEEQHTEIKNNVGGNDNARS